METNQEPQQDKRPRLDPKDNKLQVSNKKEARNFVFISKIFLKKFGNVELHALGGATKSAVRVAENLERAGVAKITKIDTFTMQLEGRRLVKMVVSLELTAEGRKRVEQDIPN